MQSEGPYKHSTYGHATGDLTRCLACAYADGRKAAEKEYEAKIGLDYTISTSVKLAAFNKLENDFRDLFNIANEMAMNLDSFTDEAGNCHIKFHAWKKARGIE